MSNFQPHEVVESDVILRGDKLILRGLMFYGFHGVKSEEKKLGQKFLIDIDAWMDLRKAGQSDDLSDTVSYTNIKSILSVIVINELCSIAKAVVEGQSYDLLESVAQLIASATLTEFPKISTVRVKVGKPHVAVPGPLDCLGVEILRYRSIDLPK